MTEYRMKYSQYKRHYADCEAVSGSYDAATKSIIVLVPDDRLKPSGTRGKRFHTYWLMVGNTDGMLFKQGFWAVSLKNAIKQAKAQFEVVIAD